MATRNSDGVWVDGDGVEFGYQNAWEPSEDEPTKRVTVRFTGRFTAEFEVPEGFADGYEADLAEIVQFDDLAFDNGSLTDWEVEG
jgi:hypothetical protein